MPNYEALYFKLFAVIADALEHMEHDNYGLARERLISAQQEAEDQYIGEE